MEVPVPRRGHRFETVAPHRGILNVHCLREVLVAQDFNNSVEDLLLSPILRPRPSPGVCTEASLLSAFDSRCPPCDLRHSTLQGLLQRKSVAGAVVVSHTKWCQIRVHCNEFSTVLLLLLPVGASASQEGLPRPCQ